jgi:hypothetical protein
LCRRNAIGYALGCEVHFSLLHVESLVSVVGSSRSSVDVVFQVYNIILCCLGRKVEQLSEEVDSLKETIDRHTLRQQKRILEAKERAELFERAVRNSSRKARIIFFCMMISID